jgi:hypothetical protein
MPIIVSMDNRGAISTVRKSLLLLMRGTKLPNE